MNTTELPTVMTRMPRHSKAPWGGNRDNAGEIESADLQVVAFVTQPQDLLCLLNEDYGRAEIESIANERLIKAAPALLSNLAYAVWCFVNGVAPTSDALANMLTAVRQGNGEGGVS